MTFLGYGTHNDSWTVALISEEIWQKGEYIASRSTGFPLFELSITPLVHLGGWYLANLLSVLFGIIIVFALFYLSDKNQLKHPLLVILSIAFLPIIITNASSTVDNIPALAFLIWAYCEVISGRYYLSAILVGIACGFRPTSGLYIIPCMVYCYKKEMNLPAPLKMGVIATLVGVIAYSPVLFKYGLLSPYQAITKSINMITIVLVGGYSFLGLFGILPTIIIMGVILYFILKPKNPEYLNSPDYYFHLTVIAVFIILFCFAPYKPYYLLPIVPSVILIIDKITTKKIFLALTILLLSYHLISFDLKAGVSGEEYISPSINRGHTIKDIQDRVFKLSTRKLATNYIADQPTVLMLGHFWIAGANKEWVFDEKERMLRQKNGNLYVSKRILEEPWLKELKEKGFRLVVWNKEKWEYIRSGNKIWRNYVEVIDDLDDFFGVHVKGKRETE